MARWVASWPTPVRRSSTRATTSSPRAVLSPPQPPVSAGTLSAPPVSRRYHSSADFQRGRSTRTSSTRVTRAVCATRSRSTGRSPTLWSA
ncbi:hypothetical protein ACFQV2_29815 [Actinokineospora soli]|uniref:Uncharacterized protein n=1 Tax=Actinokineospora soli TaxID=1048753 RepID=A0ABW2TW25_9PSEU